MGPFIPPFFIKEIKGPLPHDAYEKYGKNI